MRTPHLKKIAAILVLIAIESGFYLSRKLHPKSALNQTPPEKSVEAILEERAMQASKQLDSPLGKAMVARNWGDVQKLYHPDSSFIQLGEIIRALFIERKIKDYTPADFEKLMTLVLNTFEQMPEKNLHLSGMLVTQFERLPSPAHTSPNFKILKKWVHDPEEFPLKRKLGVEKLVFHDTNPDPEAVAVFQKALISGDTLGQRREDWIQHIDEIRNQATQTASLSLLSKNFKKITPEAEPSALIVLSHHLEITPDETKNLTLQYLRASDLPKFEAALKSLTSLIRQNRLKTSEKEEIVNRLTNIPSPVRTPFVELKSSELLKLLGHT